MDFNDLLIGLVTAVLVIVALVVLVVGTQLVILSIHQVPVEVHVNGQLVYKGINGCVAVESAGASTIVKISGGFLCFFPQARYVSNNVKVSGDKR